MSRGYGIVQRRLLAVFQEATSQPIDTITLAARAYGVTPDRDGIMMVSDAQLVTVRRALRNFAKKGAIVDLGRNFRDGRRRWRITGQD
jgi:hypothetical protein